MDFQNRVGSKVGSGGVASASESNRQRRERLRALIGDSIDLNQVSIRTVIVFLFFFFLKKKGAGEGRQATSFIIHTCSATVTWYDVSSFFRSYCIALHRS